MFYTWCFTSCTSCTRITCCTRYLSQCWFGPIKNWWKMDWLKNPFCCDCQVPQLDGHQHEKTQLDTPFVAWIPIFIEYLFKPELYSRLKACCWFSLNAIFCWLKWIRDKTIPTVGVYIHVCSDSHTQQKTIAVSSLSPKANAFVLRIPCPESIIGWFNIQ